MRQWTRRAGVTATAVGLAGVLSLSASVLSQPPLEPLRTADGAASAVLAGRAELTSGVPALQERLQRLPEDWNAWAELGSAYLTQAQLTADPTYYARAQEAYARSLAIRGEDNAPALTGQATLAASRHDFTAALELGKRAQLLNPYSASAHGVLVDALMELGRYDEAATELQRMVDLRPDVASFTRVSYYRELTGDLDGARAALQQAGRFAFSPHDSAYVERYLGELAFNAGDLETAEEHYEAGLRQVPGSPRLLAGRAKVKAAAGATDAALEDYREATARLPEPGYLIAYGELLEAVGRQDEAREQYAVVDAVEMLFRAEGANPDLELSLYAADHSRPQAALQMAERAWSVRRSIHTEDAYAWALHANGRHREALEHALEAERLGGANALFAYHRGMIEQSLGMYVEAKASLARSLAINPHFSPLQVPVAEQTLTQLQAQS